LLNPEDLLVGSAAQFGEPRLLNLDGRGVRDLAWHAGRYYIVAGSYKGGGKQRLYVWRGGVRAPREIPGIRFEGLNPEALVFYPGDKRGLFQTLSDDGNLKIGGQRCKDLADPRQRRFRSVWMR
jgi:hypothetical protein